MSRSTRWRAAPIFAGLLLVDVPALAATIEGTVFFDRDGNGVFSAADEEVPGARVAWNTAVFADADPAGRYTLAVPDDADGIVWVSVPEGGHPGPVWARAPGGSGEATVDLAIRPIDPELAGAPLRFVVAADSHIGGGAWTAGDLAAALDQAATLESPPRFFTIVGDITQANRPEEFDAVRGVLAEQTVPWVPVPGNHDWYDGGAAYRATWGPDSYSFTTGGVHFAVWNSAMSEADIVAFLERDLEGLAPERWVIALGHEPPNDSLAVQMRDLGVDALFTGHWHANRVLDHGGMPEYGTEPFLMGGIDLSPAGYRVVSVQTDGLHIVHHNFVSAPILRVVEPTADRCVADESALLVAAEGHGDLGEVTARVGGVSVPLEPAGGWLWRGRLPRLGPGVHSIAVSAGGVVQAQAEGTASICDADISAPSMLELGSWPQQQGGPEHVGVVEVAARLPYVHAWVSATGGHLHQGAPVVADGRVFVSMTDFAAGDTGGVLALDLENGAELWRYTTRYPPRNSPALDGGVLVLATSDGTVQGLEVGSGEPRWSVDLGEGVDATQSTLWAAPAIRDGVAYIGVQRKMAAIDVASGELLWSIDPYPDGIWLGSYAAASVTEDLVIASFNRTSGLLALDREDGSLRWRVDGDAVRAMNGAPVVAEGRVLVGNVRGDVSALDLATGDPGWSTRLVERGDDWTYAIGGNMAYFEGRVFVPTQWDGFYALDVDSGSSPWTHRARVGPIRATHYAGVQPGFQASPIVMGGTVWAADTSGLLVALDASSGDMRWQIDLGMPVTGGLAAAGELLLVPTFDGALHALAPAVTVPGADPADPVEHDGCSAGRTGHTAGWLAILPLLLFARRRSQRSALDQPSVMRRVEPSHRARLDRIAERIQREPGLRNASVLVAAARTCGSGSVRPTEMINASTELPSTNRSDSTATARMSGSPSCSAV